MIAVNAMGDQCPIPVIKTKKAMQALTGPETIEVLVDNETAVSNVTKMAKSLGAAVFSAKVEEGKFQITIKAEGAAVADDEPVTCVPDVKDDNTVVVISSDRMGEGNDELGKVLIKGFIFALTQLDKLPKTMLFYNGGATLTVEGSASLEDLKSLEAQGVEIMTCGTCLDYYGIKDKLAVGSVTNMYVIVDTQANAGRILKP